jgi:hypothetical protein
MAINATATFMLEFRYAAPHRQALNTEEDSALPITVELLRDDGTVVGCDNDFF